MSYTQAIGFSTSSGGNVPNLCLDNVRRGYNIANKYASAWEAWLHTEQHSDRDVPLGLDVPLYYSYIATLDGVTRNYGHINVRLANGTVWSDGNIYTSIDDYTSKKLPKFVGWGESVNDFKIIEGASMSTVGEEEFHDLFVGFFGPITDENPVWGSDRKSWIGEETNTVIRAMFADPRQQGYANSKSNGEFIPVGELFVKKG